MGVYIKGMEMPTQCAGCKFWTLIHYRGTIADICRVDDRRVYPYARDKDCPLIAIPPHGDLIDRDALIKDGWLSLHKEVMRMGGYAIHELPLKNPSIPVIIEAEGEE